MIKVDSRKLSSEDCKTLARITISARKGTPLESNRRLDDIAKIIEGLSTNDGFRILTATDGSGNIVGWIYYYTAFPLMTFISGFYPEVIESPRSDEIALALIEASKKEFVERGHTRLEIELVLPTEAHRTHSENLVELYRKCGFQFAAEEIHMKTDLSSVELPLTDLPQGYTVRKFSDVSYDMLEGPGLRTLKDSKEGLFLSMSHAEQEVTLKYFFDKSRPYIDDASLILERDGEVVGFVITCTGDDGNPDIGPVGLVPEARGQGIGSYLLVQVLKSLKSSGSTSIYLDTTVTNHPAQKLYRKYGFEDVYYKQFYYWSP
ncbi:MAG: GNAT family N-acetyltransferase [Candidatus Thorarchaeota archaeon]